MQDTGQPPSQLLRINEWAAGLLGFQDDWWTGFQFDRAVSWFGRHIESKLNEFDDKGQPRYTLTQLLGEGEKRASAKDLAQLFGVMKGD